MPVYQNVPCVQRAGAPSSTWPWMPLGPQPERAGADGGDDRRTLAREPSVAVAAAFPSPSFTPMANPSVNTAVEPALQDRRWAHPPQRELVDQGVVPVVLLLFLADVRTEHSRCRRPAPASPTRRRPSVSCWEVRTVDTGFQPMAYRSDSVTWCPVRAAPAMPVSRREALKAAFFRTSEYPQRLHATDRAPERLGKRATGWTTSARIWPRSIAPAASLVTSDCTWPPPRPRLIAPGIRPT